MAGIPLRLLIAGLVALIIVVVSTCTLVVTYLVALGSLRDIAESYALTLVSKSTVGLTSDFTKFTSVCDDMAKMMQRPGYRLPSDVSFAEWDAPQGHAYQHIQMLIYMLLGTNATVVSPGLVFVDGSLCGGYPPDPLDTNYWIFGCHSMRDAALRGGYLYEHWAEFTLDTMAYRRILRPAWETPKTDGRFDGFETALSIFPGREGFWYPLGVWHPTLSIPPMFTQLAGKPAFNFTGQRTALVAANIEVTDLSRKLQAIRVGEGTQVFALDLGGRIIGSTHPTIPLVETSITTSALTGRECVNDASSSAVFRNFTTYSLGCFKTPAQLGRLYSPLGAAEAKVPSLLRSKTPQAVALVKDDSTGDSYYVGVGSVKSTYQQFQLNVILIMPESIVIGDIVRGRNLSIGLTALFVILGSVIVFIVVYLLLMPIKVVARQMYQTAHLRDPLGTDEEAYSAFTEVKDLQRSYYNMNSAIQSFTRYVPKDVVTDLMVSGQLCEIRMDQKSCTMLFTDIQGFTTICEDVPVDKLSELISQYFDSMSNIVMAHDGLIDKYIGDCIMAVWGAPFPLANHEVKATLAGVLLDRETLVDPICSAFDKEGVCLQIRVGISTGTVLAGNMGSSKRMNYTVIGDPVNLAARLEAMNKQFGSRVMISEDTAEALGAIFILRLLMSIAVVGKQKPVKVFDVVGLAPVVPEEDRHRLDQGDTDARGGGSLEDSRSVGGTPTGRDSDRFSTMSGTAVNHTMMKYRRTTTKLIAEAMTIGTHDVPIMCSDIDVRFAAQFSLAVELCLSRQFPECIKAIEEIEVAYPKSVIGERSRMELGRTDSTSSASPSKSDARRRFRDTSQGHIVAERSIDNVLTLAEAGVRDPSSFRGYFVATEK